MYTSDTLQHFNPSVCISNKVQQINRVVANIYRKYLQPFNITDSQLTLLFVLTKKGQLTQTELCHMLHLEKSSLHRNLKRLLERQFINKEEDKWIGLTSKGLQLVKEIIPEWEKALQETEALLNEDGMQAVNTIIQKI